MKIKNKIRRFLPESIRLRINQIRRIVRYIPKMGINRYCPVCNMWSKEFAEVGRLKRKDAICMYCSALERHRLVWLYFKKKTDLFNGHYKKMLHVAPEYAFEDIIGKYVGKGYTSADLLNPRHEKMDITNIQYPDESFDIIYCSHVLEHVLDDRQAMREFFRVLKVDGWAIILVPITAESTFEATEIASHAERWKHFGRYDHVRRYGPDFVDRLRHVGFKVQVITPTDFLTKKQITCMGITKAAEDIFYCTKK